MIDKMQCYTPYTMNHNDVAERIRRKDATLWKSDPDSIKTINNSLGWLTVAGEMIGVVDELVEFAESIRSRGFQHVMVCGMGGSSLCPEVLARTFGRQPGWPELLVLDSTDPDVIAEFQRADRCGALSFCNRFKVGKHDRAQCLLQVLVRRGQQAAGKSRR